MIVSIIYLDNGGYRFRASYSSTSLEDCKKKVGGDCDSLDNLGTGEGYYKGFDLVDTMQPWEIMGTELLPVGTYVEILAGDHKGEVMKITDHVENADSTFAYQLSGEDDEYFNQHEVKPVIAKWLKKNSKDVEAAIELLKREGVLQEGVVFKSI